MACDECSQNCQLAHGKKTDLSPSVSRFFKILIGDEVSETLCLPPISAKTMSHLLGKDAKLEDSTGAQWTVTLSNYKGFLAFHKGWTKFAADHKLQLGELLVFNYLKNGHFVVHIYERTCRERTEFGNYIHPGKDTTNTEKIAADTTPSQRKATDGVSFRSVGRSSKQARPGRNLVNAKTSLEIGDGDNGTTDTEEIAADTTPSQRNATNGVSIRSVGRSSKQARLGINLVNAMTSLGMGDGDNRTTDTSESNRESSSTSVPIEPNFETPLNQPSTSNIPLLPKSGNDEQTCLDDASCVIIDRSAYYAETEKNLVLYDLSVYEMQNTEHISDKRCIDGEEGTHTRAQKFEASMAEANNTGAGFIGSKAVSKVPSTGMVQDTKASGHMGTTGMVQDTNASGHMGTTGMVQNTKASGHMGTIGNCSKSPLVKGNCSKSPLGNGFASPLPRQVHTMDTHDEIKVVKKEQVFREEASDHVQNPQDLKPSLIRDGEGPSTSRFKRKATKLEPYDSLDDEPTLFPDRVICLAGTDNCDFIELPDRLPSVAFKKWKGRVDKRCSILLIDPKSRRWPAIYLDKFGSSFGVICGWKRFNEANEVRPGDHYVFSLENGSQCTYKVDVVRT